MATLIVNTLADEIADDEQLSLREALAQAEASVGADTITFDAGLLTDGEATTATDLTLVLETDGAGHGVAVDDDGVADVTIDAGGMHRVFVVAGGDARMTGLKVADGSGRDDARGGGGILIVGGTLDFQKGVVRDNEACTGGGDIHSVGGELTLTDSTIVGNLAFAGSGGLHGVCRPIRAGFSLWAGPVGCRA